MKSNRIRTVAVGVCAALVATVLTTASSAVAKPDPMTIELTGKRSVLTLPNVPAVGGTFLGGGELYDTTATKVGRAVSSCGIAEIVVGVPPTLIAHCVTVFRLKDGDIHFGSLREYSLNRFKDTTFAITGGTGVYKEARGEAKAQGMADLGPGNYKFVITLI